MNAQERSQNLNVIKSQETVLKGAFVIFEVTNNRINLKNNKDILGKELRF